MQLLQPACSLPRVSYMLGTPAEVLARMRLQQADLLGSSHATCLGGCPEQCGASQHLKGPPARLRMQAACLESARARSWRASVYSAVTV